MSHQPIIDHYLERSLQPGFEIDQVRKELEANRVPETDIRMIVYEVDHALQLRLKEKTTQRQKTQLTLAGGILTVAGVIITVGSFLGFFSVGSVIILYGPLFGGVSLLAGGELKRRRFRR